MIVALLTDFGTRDHYVGTMKAVVLSVCPQATLVDITHEIGPQDVLEGALELAAAYRYFPAGTVFLVVIDPGVGSLRRAIAAEVGGYRFVGPDNGVLSLVFRDTPAAETQDGRSSGAPPRPGQSVGPLDGEIAGQIVELRERKFARTTISKTFEGRDRFAPAAGWLARGTALAAFGPPVRDPVTLDVPAPVVAPDSVSGLVLRVDRFGNLITNIHRQTLGAAERSVVTIAGREITRLVTTYAEVGEDELCALIGSTGYLEIARNRGSAADELKVGRNEMVVIRRG